MNKVIVFLVEVLSFCKIKSLKNIDITLQVSILQENW